MSPPPSPDASAAKATAAGAPPLTLWVLTDGKAGDEIPCLGVAEELIGVRDAPWDGGIAAPPMDPELRYPVPLVSRTYATGRIEIRRVAPHPPWVWFMPRGPIDPRDTPDHADSPILPPYPDVLIASGRRSIAYVRAVKRLSGGRTFTAILKDPRTSDHGADFVWVPEHDRSRVADYMRTLTTPHRFSAERIALAKATLPQRILALPGPRVTLLLGGRTRRGPFIAADRDRLCAALRDLCRDAGSFLVTVSRRTPPDLLAAVKKAIDARPSTIWDNSGPNPYLNFLAAADAIVATGDSHTMISEAASTGAPLMIFQPTCIKPKLTYFGLRMVEEGWAAPFDGTLKRDAPVPHDATAIVAAEIRRRLQA
ncbi:MAG: mitochondrial fission ELM1 family protein [Ancalomicrobiaceae bacterium]|nr:mitochondrial fission ELM1 family protein [Ancalomicrobiaceae bacterium]